MLVDFFVPKQTQRTAVGVDRASTETAAGRMSPGLNVAVVTQLVTHRPTPRPVTLCLQSLGLGLADYRCRSAAPAKDRRVILQLLCRCCSSLLQV